MFTSGKGIHRVSLAAACALIAPALCAQPAGQGEDRSDIGFKLGTGYSDNVFQRTATESSGSYSLLGTLVDFYRDSRRLRAEIVGDMEFRNYSEAQVEDELYGALTAEMEVQAVPERFSWLVSERYGEGRVDPFRPSGPDNRQQVNIFATGPAVYLPVGERTELRLSALAGQRSYEDSEGFDNDTVQTGAGIYRELSSTSEIGISLGVRDVEYDAPSLDNTIETGFINYRKQFATGEASLAVGTNRVEFVANDESSPYVSIDWSRDVGSRTSLSFNISNRLVDSGDSFRGGQDFDDAIRSVDVFERSSVGLTLSVQSARSQLSVGGRVGEDSYENESELDNDIFQLFVAYERTIAAQLQGGASVYAVDREFQTTAQQDEDLRLNLWVEKFFGRKLAVRAEYLFNTRDGQNATGFDENTIRLAVQYRLNPRQATL